MDPKHNRNRDRPKPTHEESQHNKSNAGHERQPQQPSGRRTEQKKRPDMS